MAGVRLAPLLLALVLLAPAPAGAAPGVPRGPAHAWVVGAGASLASPSGHPLFPTLAGRPVAGFLGAFGGEAMGTAWGGYAQRHPLGPGLEVLVARASGLLASYLIRKDAAGTEACLGHVIHEPRVMEGADAAERTLRRAGYAVRRGFLATRGALFAADAGFLERRAAGHVERYVFARLPGRGPEPPRLLLAEVAYYPAAHEAGLGAWTAEGREALAAFLQAREQAAAPNTTPL